MNIKYLYSHILIQKSDSDRSSTNKFTRIGPQSAVIQIESEKLTQCISSKATSEPLYDSIDSAQFEEEFMLLGSLIQHVVLRIIGFTFNERD
ncbi:hypothetical protein SS50377_27869 [Spironucleus salmonicida]|uniref:Uncharacterized protein n=1 Tax=Spironucleus salmonicida TaxID=348837 RepID=A0A9P8RUN3_9EUKA|nr:hypothetical protein SS50377_27869 [Spironucleus salmonicida]